MWATNSTRYYMLALLLSFVGTGSALGQGGAGAEAPSGTVTPALNVEGADPPTKLYNLGDELYAAGVAQVTVPATYPNAVAFTVTVKIKKPNGTVVDTGGATVTANPGETKSFAGFALYTVPNPGGEAFYDVEISLTGGILTLDSKTDKFTKTP